MTEGAQIVEMHALMEANIPLIDLENNRILKEMRNSVNRNLTMPGRTELTCKFFFDFS